MDMTKTNSRPPADPIRRRAEFEQTGRLEFETSSPSPDDLASASTTASESPDPDASAEQEKREAEQKKKSEIKRNWLMGEPQTWVGRRVRCKRNNAVYTITEIFRTGRVKMERNWMTYLSAVQTVRADYETYC
jgi:hypothetical protein